MTHPAWRALPAARRAAGRAGFSTLEAVLTVLLVAAFLAVVGPLVLRGRVRDRWPGDDGALALAAESAAEEALARAPAAAPAPSLDGTPVADVAVAVEPGPRGGLERVRFSAVEPRDVAEHPGLSRRVRLVVVRFVP